MAAALEETIGPSNDQHFDFFISYRVKHDREFAQESTAWAVGDKGTILQTGDRGLTWTSITDEVIRSLDADSLKNGRRLTEISLRAVKHHKIDKEVPKQQSLSPIIEEVHEA